MDDSADFCDECGYLLTEYEEWTCDECLEKLNDAD